MGAIIVTGSGRSGTSLMMQMLKFLGIPVSGSAFIEGEQWDEELHPGGTWDLPAAETIDGIRGHKYDGTAVKLFGHQLYMSDEDVIDSVIVCLRGIDACRESMLRMLEIENPLGVEKTPEFVDACYVANYGAIFDFLNGNDVRRLFVRFDDMVSGRALSLVSRFVTGKDIEDSVAKKFVGAVVNKGVAICP